jgi:adhesin/invasin
VFGTVTETATKGTYTALFTGLTAGTADTLTVSVGGVNFATTPAVQVTPSGIDATKSTISFARPTDTSGQTDQVTIVLKDANGNAVTGISGLAFQLALSGGTSAGTFGPVSETATKGTYTALFTGTTAGTNSAVTTTVAGVTLAGKPVVQVIPGLISVTNSTASFARPRVLVGYTDKLTIVVQDANGNAITGLPSSAFQFTLSGGTGLGTFGTVVETQTKGTYVVVFTGTKVGTTDTLTIKVNGLVLVIKPRIEVV